MDANIIKEIERRYAIRKKAKKKFDSVINLAVSGGKESRVVSLSADLKGQTVRLLDEGMVVDANGIPLFYIKKGVLQAFYDALPRDYVGSINLGHMDFASFPFLIGQWTKEDLSLVDIGDGRKALDINLRLDENSVFVRELRRNQYTVGVSAEFSYSIDYESSELLRLEVLDSVNIKDIGIVGEAGNVNSGGVHLKMKGETEMKSNILEKLLNKYLGANPGTGDGGAHAPGPDAGEGKDKGSESGVTKKDTDVPQSDADKGSEGLDVSKLLAAAGEALENQEKMLQLMDSMDKENERLAADLSLAVKERDEARNQLSGKDKAIEDALGRFKNLAVKYGSERGRRQNDDNGETDLKNELSEDGLGVL